MPWPPSSVPLDTASNRPKAGTTEPAGSTSILRSPPVMSLTFLAKSSAYSWKMSFDGQVLWKRRLVVVCAVAIIGVAIAPAVPTAVAAFFRKRRRGALDAGARGVCLAVKAVSDSEGCWRADRSHPASSGIRPFMVAHRLPAAQVGEARRE